MTCHHPPTPISVPPAPVPLAGVFYASVLVTLQTLDEGSPRRAPYQELEPLLQRHLTGDQPLDLDAEQIRTLTRALLCTLSLVEAGVVEQPPHHRKLTCADVERALQHVRTPAPVVAYA